MAGPRDGPSAIRLKTEAKGRTTIRFSAPIWATKLTSEGPSQLGASGLQSGFHANAPRKTEDGLQHATERVTKRRALVGPMSPLSHSP